jgi:hypothetical protein
MKRLSIIIASLVVSGALVFAHEGNEHVRGVVTGVSAQSITVQTTDKRMTTLKVTAKTTFQLNGKVAHLTDLKVGDRVVVDVPEKTSDALLVQIGTAAEAAQTAAKAAAAVNKLAIAFLARPSKTGENTFEVLVKDGAGKPVMGADVSVLLFMPAMPAMKMPEMRSEVKLKDNGSGKYTGTGQVATTGMWTVTVSVKQGGTEIGQSKSTLTVR